MTAVPENKPRGEVTHLPAPRASLGTADKTPSAGLVAKAPVKFTFQKMNSVVLLWFLMTSWKESQWLFRQAGMTSKHSGFGCAWPNSIIKPFSLEEQS